MQDDSMDGIGRVESGTETEQLPRRPGATFDQARLYGCMRTARLNFFSVTWVNNSSFVRTFLHKNRVGRVYYVQFSFLIRC